MYYIRCYRNEALSGVVPEIEILHNIVIYLQYSICYKSLKCRGTKKVALCDLLVIMHQRLQIILYFFQKFG